MKFQNINLAGFGKLVKCEYNFTPGLNLVVGPNESGKSTLQRALLVGLYSFFDDGTITANKRAGVANFQPWAPYTSYGLSVVFSLDNGKHYQVKRTFDPYETSITDLTSKRDITEKFSRGSNGRIYFADSLLGMPKEVFENTCFVRQAELVALEKSASAIRDTLLKLSASASQEATVTQALEQIDEILKNQIGNERARVKPLPIASSKITSLNSERVKVVNERATLETQNNQLAQLEGTFKNKEHEIEEKKYLLLVARKDEIGIQLGSIDRAVDEEQALKIKVDELQNWSGFSADLVPTYQKLKAERGQSLVELARRKQRALQGLQGLPELHQQMIKIVHELSSHSQRPTVAIDPPPQLENDNICLVDKVEEWSRRSLEILEIEMLSFQEIVSLEKAALAPVIDPGGRDISNWVEDIHSARSRLDHSEEDLRKANETWTKAGFPMNKWDSILAEKQSQADKYASWKDFPVQRWNDIQLLERQRAALQERLAANTGEHEQRLLEFKSLEEQIAALEEAKRNLEPLPSLDNERQEELQNLYYQVDQEIDSVRRAEGRLKIAEQGLQEVESELSPERQALELILQEGPDIILVLKSKLQLAQEKLVEARQRHTNAQGNWERVGMPVSKFLQLEATVKSIQSGGSPTPTRRKGCLSFLMPLIAKFRRVKTPDEFVLYGQLQPIYSEYDRRKLELDEAEGELQSFIREAERIIGPGIPVEPATLDSLSQRLSAYHLKANRLESQAANVAEIRIEINQANEDYTNKTHILLDELRLLGIDGDDLSRVWQIYQDVLKQIQRWNSIKVELDHNQLRHQALKHQMNGFQEQSDELSALEKRLFDLLYNPTDLEEGLRQFRFGLQQHQTWIQLNDEAEKTLNQIHYYQTQHQELTESHDKIEAEYNNVRAQICTVLTGLVTATREDLGLELLNRRLESFKEMKKILDSTRQRLETLHIKVQAILKDGMAWQEMFATIDEQSRNMIVIFASANIPCELDAIDEGAKQFDETARQHIAWQEAFQAHQSAAQTVLKLQEGLTQSKTQLTGFESQLAGMQKKNPRLKSLQAKESAQVYQHTIETLETEQQSNRSQMVRLRDATKKAQSQLRNLAELDEEIAQAQAEVARLEFFQSSIELARNTLQIAAKDFQKEFAPRLEMEMKPALKRITQSRYEDIHVSPDTLDVEVLSPEQKKFVSTGVLSTGTRDLIYLILRVGLARLMGNSGEKLPLLLDDPLVQYDSRRKREALDYLLSLAETTQVFLFSADIMIKDLLSDERGKSIHQVIELA